MVLPSARQLDALQNNAFFSFCKSSTIGPTMLFLNFHQVRNIEAFMSQLSKIKVRPVQDMSATMKDEGEDPCEL